MFSFLTCFMSRWSSDKFQLFKWNKLGARLSHRPSLPPLPGAPPVVICSLHTSPAICFCMSLLCLCVRAHFQVYGEIRKCRSILPCLLQQSPTSSLCAQGSLVSRAHVRTWVSMMHQGASQISFHPPRASSPLFIWLLGCSINDISSAITLKRIQDTDTLPSIPLYSHRRVQGLAFLSQNVCVMCWCNSKDVKHPI